MTSVPLPSADRSSLKIAGKEINIPPVTIPSSLAPTKNITRSPFKFHKVDVRKHEKKQIINVTSHPLIKETTVIDENSANFMSNVTDSEMINSSINAINLTYLETENHTTSFNRTEISGNLSAAGITGITMGCVSFVGIICAVSFVIYRNRGLNRPQVLNDRCSNPDSSGYIDDASIRVRVHIYFRTAPCDYSNIYTSMVQIFLQL